MANIGKIIADAQITNGGPVILVQPENEYTGAVEGVLFPDPAYMQYVEDQLHNAGIVVPLISNDASPRGHNAPGTGEGEVDIYVSGKPLYGHSKLTWSRAMMATRWGSTAQIHILGLITASLPHGGRPIWLRVLRHLTAFLR